MPGWGLGKLPEGPEQRGWRRRELPELSTGNEIVGKIADGGRSRFST